MAEGAIEGAARDYIVSDPTNTSFAYDRFDKKAADLCAPRNTSMLTARKPAQSPKTDVFVGASDDD